MNHDASPDVKGRGYARACANIALIKYWGKIDADLNLPAVPSLSLTLRELETDTEVVLDASLRENTFALRVLDADGKPLERSASDVERKRIDVVVAAMQREAKSNLFAHVRSQNNFPTASGLASSSSGFAALIASCRQAYGLSLESDAISRQARQASASAARSVFGGFAELKAGTVGDATLSATPLPYKTDDIVVVVGVTTETEKSLSSTVGMQAAHASAFYPAWLERSRVLFDEAKTALAAGDFRTLGEAGTESFLLMHSLSMTARPPHFYWLPGSLALIDSVERLRRDGVPVFATMDAGPHVKAFALREALPRVQQALIDAGALRVLVCTPGEGVSWL